MGSISGVIITRAGEPLPNVVVTATGGANDTTAADGSYSISDLAAGTYTITPVLSGYAFSPSYRSVTLGLGANATSQNFDAAVVVSPSTDPPYVFTWDDSVQAAYSTTIWLPSAVAAPQEKRESLVSTLNLGLLKMTQVKAGTADQRAPRRYELTWDVLEDEDRDVHAMIETTWLNGRAVTCSFHRGGAQVTCTGYYVTAYDDPEVEDSGGLRGLRITLQECRV